MPLPLISSRLLKHRTTKKFERQVRMHGRTLLQQMSDKSLPHPFTEEEISTAEDETSDSPRLRQHPRGIPEEPGPQSSHMAVQILLQNHGYPFHPEDLEKGQDNSRLRIWLRSKFGSELPPNLTAECVLQAPGALCTPANFSHRRRFILSRPGWFPERSKLL